jgi:hypothetical protein
MHRLRQKLPYVVASLFSYGCGGDEPNTSGFDDAGTGGSNVSDDASTGQPTDATSTSASNGAGEGSATSGTSAVDDGSTSGSATDGGDVSSSSDSVSTSGTDGGSGSSGDTGGPGKPLPSRFPGIEQGLCAPPGEWRYCYTGAPVTYPVGECAPGVQECLAEDLDFGYWGPCEGETLPATEVCDGLDNDCDGDVDEDQGSTTCGMGLCEHSEPNCVSGSANECDPFDGATPEICDLIDNDCDGDIDEGLGDETISCGVGACEHEVTACQDGQELECDPFAGAGPEVCDDIDNDCDGQTDEGLGTLSCGVGVCEHTVAACINGNPQICDEFEGASTEICDLLDNDCDGDVDEDQGVWTCGQDDCEVSVPQCINGQPQPPSTCQPIPGGDEICGDGIDNNCDGEAPPCAESFLVGTDTTVRPIDVIWMVDSSGSMALEMATVEAEINDFATTLANSGSATTLHLIADRGIGEFEICVDPPLSTGGCADNPGAGFFQYDTNSTAGTGFACMVHSSNALGRAMQQSSTWMGRLQENSHIAFIVTSDDDGDDPTWLAPDDNDEADDPSSTLSITDATTDDRTRWTGPPGTGTFTSLANDHGTLRGFTSFMSTFFPESLPGEDWSFFSIIGNTGTAVLTGADDVYEFNDCATSREDGDEYVKLSLLTGRQSSMISICELDWDLSGLADDIVSGVPNDLFVLQGSPSGTCGNVDPATITVVVNGIPLSAADWNYDAATCTLQITNNVPVVGDTVSVVYENF